MSASTNLMRLIWKAAADVAGAALFRNNSGMGWQGEPTHDHKRGLLILRNYRPVRFGVGPNSKDGADLIGWRSIQVTPDMVGKPVALFVALEVKAGVGQANEGQNRFVDAVRKAGGIGGVVRSEADAVRIMGGAA